MGTVVIIAMITLQSNFSQRWERCAQTFDKVYIFPAWRLFHMVYFLLRIYPSIRYAWCSALVNPINHTKPAEAMESTILGPFFTTDAHNGMLA